MLCVPLAAFAVKNGLEPYSKSGGYYSKTVNRMDFAFENTDFSLKKTTEGAETFILTSVLTVRKCESDLFARINTVELDGIDCNYIVFTAAEENGEAVRPENLTLRNDSTLKWTLEISVNINGAATLAPELVIDFASGLTLDTADEHQLRIPLKINSFGA